MSLKEIKELAFKKTLKNALGWSCGLLSYIGLGCLMPDPTFLTMLTTFSLSLVAGY